MDSKMRVAKTLTKFMILQEKYFRAASVTDSVFTHGKLCIKLYTVN